MNKTEFFSKLNSKLSILNEKERRDIIEEYKNHIEFKMQDGKTEEQAIADFGDIDNLVEEILEAYHINENTVINKNFEYYVKAFISYINQTTEKILSLSMGDITRIFIEFLIVLGIIFLMSIPFEMLRSAFQNIFYFLPSLIRNPINSIISLIFEVIKLSISLVIIYNFIKTRVMSRESIYKTNNITDNSFINNNYNNSFSSNEYITPDKSNIFSSFKKKDKINSDNSGTFDDYQSKSYDINTRYNPNFSQPKEKSNTLGKFIVKFIVCVLKILLFFTIWIPCLLLSILFIIATVVFLFFMITQHIGLWGLCICFLGCSVILTSFTLFMTDIIFSKNNKNKEMPKDEAEEIEEI